MDQILLFIFLGLPICVICMFTAATDNLHDLEHRRNQTVKEQEADDNEFSVTNEEFVT